MDPQSITIEVENERCPVALEPLLNQSKFTVNLNPKGGVGDFEIINSKGETVILGQKHLSTISLLEHISRSEVLTVDLSDTNEMTVACPPDKEIAIIRNLNMGLLSPNTLTIQGKNGSETRFSFKFQNLHPHPSSNSKEEEKEKFKYNYQVVNDESILIAEISASRMSSKVGVSFPGQVSVTPVQAAVIFGGLALQIYAIKKQRKWMALLTTGAFLVLLIFLIILVVMMI